MTSLLDVGGLEAVANTNTEQVGVKIQFKLGAIEGNLGVSIQVFVIYVEIQVVSNFEVGASLSSLTDAIVYLAVESVHFGVKGENNVYTKTDIRAYCRPCERVILQGDCWG